VSAESTDRGHRTGRTGESRWSRRLGALALGLVLAFGLCEAGVRLAGLHVARRGGRTDRVLERVEGDPDFAFRLAPGTPSQHYRNADGTTTRVRYTINPQGFRGVPVPRSKPPGTLRVGVVGDSFVFGTGVADDETLPHALERRLHELHPDRSIEVLNFGVPGYGIEDLGARLRRDLLPFEPDVVLFSLYVNDAVATLPGNGPRSRAEAKLVTPELAWIRRLGLTSNLPAETDGLPTAQRWMIPVRRASRFLDVAGDRLFQSLFSRHTRRIHAHSWREGGPGWARVREVLTAARDLGRARGFTLHVSFYPLLDELDDYPYRDVHARVGRFCAQLGVPFHDFRIPLEGADASTLWAHVHDHHPNGACHERVAAWLAPRLDS